MFSFVTVSLSTPLTPSNGQTVDKNNVKKSCQKLPEPAVVITPDLSIQLINIICLAE